MPSLNRKIAIAAHAERTRARAFREGSTGTSLPLPITATVRICVQRVWIANHMARLRIIPTIAAVIAVTAGESARLPRSRSTGAPAKIHRKQGINVTQVVRIAPNVAATSGDNSVTSRKTARKLTNCVTMIRGVKQPTDVGGELLRFAPRKQHAVVQRMQEALLLDPLLLFDKDAVHHGDLTGRPAGGSDGSRSARSATGISWFRHGRCMERPCRCQALGRLPAIHVENRSCYVSRCRACQKRHCSRDIRRCAIPT